jgi:hypothetical protein
VIARSMHSVRAVVARANWRGFLSPEPLRSDWNNRSCGEFPCWTAPMHPPSPPEESGPDGEPRRASGSRGSVFLRQSELTTGCARQAGGHRHLLWPGAVGQAGLRGCTCAASCCRSLLRKKRASSSLSLVNSIISRSFRRTCLPAPPSILTRSANSSVATPFGESFRNTDEAMSTKVHIPTF